MESDSLKNMLTDIAIKERNKIWENNTYIPSWVDPRKVGLDQFFTKPEIALKCYRSFIEYMRSDGADVQDYNFIEPSAGTGAFYDLLPENNRMGIDILPLHPDIVRADFLSWNAPDPSMHYAVVGNPPFGYRGWLALAFVNHAAQFADYVGMILPMSFQSDGKGSPKHRVKGLRLAHQEYLPSGSFVRDDGRVAQVNALWQIWQRGVNNLGPHKTCNGWLDLFTVDMRQERRCGHNRMRDADYFLQRTFYTTPPRLVEDFTKVRYVCGYGLILKREKSVVYDVLNQTDWSKYSNLAAHNCRHISMYHIQKAVTDAGFVDA